MKKRNLLLVLIGFLFFAHGIYAQGYYESTSESRDGTQFKLILRTNGDGIHCEIFYDNGDGETQIDILALEIYIYEYDDWYDAYTYIFAGEIVDSRDDAIYRAGFTVRDFVLRAIYNLSDNSNFRNGVANGFEAFVLDVLFADINL